MSRILIIARNPGTQVELRNTFSHNGFTCAAISSLDELEEYTDIEAPVLVLAVIDNQTTEAGELTRTIKEELRLPIIAIIPPETLKNSQFLQNQALDDFVVTPYNPSELVLRVKRTLHLAERKTSKESIVCGDLIIDTARCEVTLCGGVIILTFMEYELLKFLASNQERVFTREALLNNVWGYDYYGGDRTVDVHIRRLRSKIEDANHTFIETVRNIGYRFKAGNQTPAE